jgi:hypothetical protein
MDQMPSLVLGQPDFNSHNPNYPSGIIDEVPKPSEKGLYELLQITFDRNGDLWVADYYNHRVLKFDHNPSLIEYAHPTTKYPPPIIKYTPSSPSSLK